MKWLLRAVRWILGQTIVLIDRLTRPKPLRRSPDEQAEVDKQAAQLALYQFRLCPFCVKVRRTVHRLALPIELRDARNDPKWHRELVEQGGRYQVPCLKIIREDGSVEWLYESDDINAWLEQRFGQAQQNA